MKINIDSKAKGLIFDLDGTLIDSMPVHYEAWRDVLAKYGYDLTLDELNRVAGIPTIKVAEIFLSKINAKVNYEEVVSEKEKIYLSRIKEIRVIEPVFEIVKENYKKLPMTVGTGGYRKNSLLLLEFTGLLNYFDGVVSADDVKNFKPEPETFLKCAEIMKIDPKDCQVFEDAENGIIAAEKAGMMVIDLRKYL